jgi:hypothetical protein
MVGTAMAPSGKLNSLTSTVAGSIFQWAVRAGLSTLFLVEDAAELTANQHLAVPAFDYQPPGLPAALPEPLRVNFLREWIVPVPVLARLTSLHAFVLHVSNKAKPQSML